MDVGGRRVRTVSHQPCFGYQVWKEQGVGVAAPLAFFPPNFPQTLPPLPSTQSLLAVRHCSCHQTQANLIMQGEEWGVKSTKEQKSPLSHVRYSPGVALLFPRQQQVARRAGRQVTGAKQRATRCGEKGMLLAINSKLQKEAGTAERELRRSP